MAIDINVPSQVKTYANLAAFPATGSLKTIFIAEDTNKTYRWTGSVYVEVSAAGATGITIGTTAITSGTVGRVLFEGTGNVVQESANLFWDNTNGRLGIGTSTPTQTLDVVGVAKFNQNGTSVILNNPSGRYTDLGFSNADSIKSFVSLDNSQFYLDIFNSSNYGLRLWTNNAERMRIPTTGNVLINTTTDAGFKLDVNGTARINTLNIGLGGGQIALNTAIGVNALNANTTGTANTVYGNASGRLNIDGSNNTFIGRASGEGNTSGGNNTFLGAVSGTANSSGGNNVFIGRETGSVNTTGSTNTSIGTRAGNANTTGSNNIFIGYLSTGVSATESNRTWIGNSSTTTTWLAGNVLIGTTTDAGYKLDVNGTARVKGTGTTSATTAFTVQDSAGVNSFIVRDDGFFGKVIPSSTGTFNIAGQSGSAAASLFQNGISNFSAFRVQMNGQTLIDEAGVNAFVATSAIFELKATTKGFLPPRLTTTQKNAIASPATGLMVYDNVLNRPCFYDGTSWITL